MDVLMRFIYIFRKYFSCFRFDDCENIDIEFCKRSFSRTSRSSSVSMSSLYSVWDIKTQRVFIFVRGFFILFCYYMDTLLFIMFMCGVLLVAISIFKSQLKCNPSVEVIKYVQGDCNNCVGNSWKIWWFVKIKKMNFDFVNFF